MSKNNVKKYAQKQAVIACEALVSKNNAKKYDVAAAAERRALEQQVAVPVHALEPGAAALGLTRLWPDRFDAPPAAGVAYHDSRAAGPAGAASPPPVSGETS